MFAIVLAEVLYVAWMHWLVVLAWRMQDSAASPGRWTRGPAAVMDASPWPRRFPCALAQHTWMLRRSAL